MGPEFLERITESANFTTEDYFTWMAGDGKWASEKSRDAFRLGWMENTFYKFQPLHQLLQPLQEYQFPFHTNRILPSYHCLLYNAFRLGWMEEKLVRHGKWTEDEFTQNYPDIKYIMDNNSAAVFREDPPLAEMEL